MIRRLDFERIAQNRELRAEVFEIMAATMTGEAANIARREAAEHRAAAARARAGNVYGRIAR